MLETNTPLLFSSPGEEEDEIVHTIDQDQLLHAPKRDTQKSTGEFNAVPPIASASSANADDELYSVKNFAI